MGNDRVILCTINSYNEDEDGKEITEYKTTGGPSLWVTREIMKALRCENALILDGGGSTQIRTKYKGKDESFSKETRNTVSKIFVIDDSEFKNTDEDKLQ